MLIRTHSPISKKGGKNSERKPYTILSRWYQQCFGRERKWRKGGRHKRKYIELKNGVRRGTGAKSIYIYIVIVKWIEWFHQYIELLFQHLYCSVCFSFSLSILNSLLSLEGCWTPCQFDTVVNICFRKNRNTTIAHSNFKDVGDHSYAITSNDTSTLCFVVAEIMYRSRTYSKYLSLTLNLCFMLCILQDNCIV